MKRIRTKPIKRKRTKPLIKGGFRKRTKLYPFKKFKHWKLGDIFTFQNEKYKIVDISSCNKNEKNFCGVTGIAVSKNNPCQRIRTLTLYM